MFYEHLVLFCIWPQHQRSRSRSHCLMVSLASLASSFVRRSLCGCVVVAQWLGFFTVSYRIVLQLRICSCIRPSVRLSQLFIFSMPRSTTAEVDPVDLDEKSERSRSLDWLVYVRCRRVSSTPAVDASGRPAVSGTSPAQWCHHSSSHPAPTTPLSTTKQDFLLTQSHVHIAADTEKVFQTNVLSRWAKTIGLPAIGFNEAHIVFATAPNLNRSTKLCRTVMRHKESPRENMGWNLLCGTIAPPVHHTAALRPVTFPLPVRP